MKVLLTGNDILDIAAKHLRDKGVFGEGNFDVWTNTTRKFRDTEVIFYSKPIEKPTEEPKEYDPNHKWKDKE